LLREYRFRLDRTETGLRRRRGLLTLTDVTIPVRRAQAAIIANGPVRAAFGWHELKLQSLAGDQPGTGDHVLAPLASDDEVSPIVSELGWRPVPDAVPWTRVSRTYIWLRAIMLSPLLLLFGLQAAVLAVVPALVPESARAQGVASAIVVLLLLAIVVRWLDWRRTGYVLDGDRLLVRRGWWWRRLLILPVNKIQSIDLRTSALGRWFGIETLRFGVAGGSGFSAHLIPAIPSAAARQLRKDLLDSPA
jgi:putative membrane protein